MSWADVMSGEASWAIEEADCLEVLQALPRHSVDAVVSDPPFAFAGGISNGMGSRADSQFFEHWLADVFRQLYRVSKPEAPWFLWSDWRTAPVYDAALARAAPDGYSVRYVSQVIIHDREMIGMGAPFRNSLDYIALVRGPATDFKDRIPKDQANLIRSYWYFGKHEHHPAEKSPAVARQLVEWASDEGDLVLDPFAGSGTTGLGALAAGRRFIGIEKDMVHAATARIRLHAAPPLEGAGPRGLFRFGEVVG